MVQQKIIHSIQEALCALIVFAPVISNNQIKLSQVAKNEDRKRKNGKREWGSVNGAVVLPKL